MPVIQIKILTPFQDSTERCIASAMLASEQLLILEIEGLTTDTPDLGSSNCVALAEVNAGVYTDQTERSSLPSHMLIATSESLDKTR